MVLKIADMMKTVKEKKPLVHHITNYVTVNDCANICICAGGSPVMTDEYEDIPDMVKIASAVVLNIGTLNDRTINSMFMAGKAANEIGIPVILDPVGAGATRLRTRTAEFLMDKVKISVVKGNAGEIGMLAGLGGEVKGVDSVGIASEDAAQTLAKRIGCIVAATGETDYVSNGKKTYILKNGDPLLGSVSGTGCMACSVVGCYVGACGASIDSVAAGISAFCIAGEGAAKTSKGPGTFKMNLMDSMFALTPEMAQKALKIQQ